MTQFPRRVVVAAFAALAMAVAAPSWAAEKLKVVATFSILGDMVNNVAGEHIVLTTLVGPEGDTHVFEPTPADARALAEADLVFVNGLGFEGWMDRLIKASGYEGPVVVASEGIALIELEEGHEHHHGDKHHAEHDSDKHDSAHKSHDAKSDDKGEEHDEHFDPHGWNDLANGRVYVANIARALATADTANASDYQSRAEAYDRQLVALDSAIRRQLEDIPKGHRKVVTSHDAFQYFARAYNVEFFAPVGLSTEDEPSAGEVAALIRQMRKDNIRALFVDNISDPRMMQQLAREAEAVIGGKLYPGSLSTESGPAPTYLDLFRHNVSEIVKAFSS